ncbi:MAG: hypothetical protein J3R72DRAFT_447835, partial [Linnemannia gamsii]
MAICFHHSLSIMFLFSLLFLFLSFSHFIPSLHIHPILSFSIDRIPPSYHLLFFSSLSLALSFSLLLFLYVLFCLPM